MFVKFNKWNENQLYYKKNSNSPITILHSTTLTVLIIHHQIVAGYTFAGGQGVQGARSTLQELLTPDAQRAALESRQRPPLDLWRGIHDRRGAFRVVLRDGRVEVVARRREGVFENQSGLIGDLVVDQEVVLAVG